MSKSNNQLDWGYDERDNFGPNQWQKYYPSGKNQSPINILVGCDPSSMSAYCCANDCIPNRLANELKLNDSSTNENNCNNDNRQQVNATKRRCHLNSIGEENRRSPSTLSSCSSSHQATGTDEDSDDSGANRSEHCDSSKSKCATSRQDCQLQNTRHFISHKKIFIGYPRYMNTMQLCNTGHNWQIDLPPEISTNTLLSGPPFGDREYRLIQLHAHWGEDCDNGSEHQINGKSFAAEIHFVHWNCRQFKDANEASKHKHGLAVLGVLVQAVEGEQNRNKHLDKIINGLSSINEPETCTSLNSKLDLKKLFPTNRWIYASYEGSLTTPPLSEVVDWVVFLSPIQCSVRQIEQFRQIKCSTKSKNNRLIKNCRPIQPLNGRTVSIWTHH